MQLLRHSSHDMKNEEGKTPSQPLRPVRAELLWWFGVSILGLAAAWFFARMPGQSVDWTLHFFPAGRLYVAGETLLYDAQTTGFYHPPWVIWLLLPFTSLPIGAGLFVLRVASVLMVGLAVRTFVEGWPYRVVGMMIAIVNLHFVDLGYRGQITAFNALGAALAWIAYTRKWPLVLGGSYILLTVSAPNALPFALVMVWASWKTWELKDWLYSLILPGIVGALSFFAFGLWPLHWVENMQLRPPAETVFGTEYFTTIWWASDLLNLPYSIPIVFAVGVIGVMVWAWHQLDTDDTKPFDVRLIERLLLVTTAVFLISPWSLSYRFVLLYGIAVPYLFTLRPRWVIVIQLLALMPLLRMLISPSYAWIDLLYVLVIFGAVLSLLNSAKEPAL